MTTTISYKSEPDQRRDIVLIWLWDNSPQKARKFKIIKLNALCSAIKFHYFTLIEIIIKEWMKKYKKKSIFENYYLFCLLFRAFAGGFYVCFPLCASHTKIMILSSRFSISFVPIIITNVLATDDFPYELPFHL